MKALTFEGDHTGVKEVSISDIHGHLGTVRVTPQIFGNKTLMFPSTPQEAHKTLLLLEK